MKRIISHSLWIFALAILASCTTTEPNLFGDIYGMVKDVNGQPVSAAEISLQPSGKTTVSGSTGDFEFNSLDAGQYTVLVKKDGYESDTKTVKVIAGETARVDFIIKKVSATNGFTVSTSSLNFSATTTTQSFDITNTSNSGSITWSIEDVPNWLTVSPMQGTTATGKSSAVVVKADLSKQSVATSTVIRVVSGGESKTINVHLNIEEQNPLSISTNSLYFSKNDNSKDFTITNIGNASAGFTITNNPSWLTITPKSGELTPNETMSITANVDRSQLTKSTTVTLSITSGKYTNQLTVKVDVEGDSGAGSGDSGDNGSGSGSDNGSGSGNTTNHDFSKVEIIPCDEDLQFEIIDCVFTSTGAVELSFKVKNIGSNNLSLDFRSSYSDTRTYSYDNDGNKVDISSIAFGSKDGNSSCTLPAGVMTKCYVKFSNVNKNATLFTNVTIYTYRPTVSTLVFNNLPIYK